MIVNVGLSPSSLVDISERKLGRKPHALVLQRAMVDCLSSHGTLMFSSKDEANALLRLIKTGSQLTASERQSWITLFSWLTKGERVGVAQPSYSALENLQSVDEAAQILHRPFVAVVPETTFGKLYPGNADGWAPTSPDLDITTGVTVSLSTQFTRVQSAAASESYPPGTAREAVWEELLRPLAARTKRVTLFDRFGFAELYRRDATQNPAAEHLVWLLRKLNVDGAPGTLVKIYGAIDYTSGPAVVPSSAASIAQLLRQRWSPTPGRLAEVELVTLNGTHAFPHDRHATFGESTGLELPSGLDRLAPAVSSAPLSFGYKWKREQLQALRDRVALVEHKHPHVTTAYLKT